MWKKTAPIEPRRTIEPILAVRQSMQRKRPSSLVHWPGGIVGKTGCGCGWILPQQIFPSFLPCPLFFSPFSFFASSPKDFSLAQAGGLKRVLIIFFKGITSILWHSGLKNGIQRQIKEKVWMRTKRTGQTLRNDEVEGRKNAPSYFRTLAICAPRPGRLFRWGGFAAYVV